MKYFLSLSVFLMTLPGVSFAGDPPDLPGNYKDPLGTTLDFHFLDEHARKIELPDGHMSYYLEKYLTEDGTAVQIRGNTKMGFVEQHRPPLPAYWVFYKVYDCEGRIRERGFGLNDMYTKIGVWEYFDEDGAMYDDKNPERFYGIFSYRDILDFLKENGYLKEDNKGIENVSFYFNHEMETWVINIYLKNWTEKKTYVFDTHTGEILNQLDHASGELKAADAA